MIAFLDGVLAGRTPQAAYIDVNGVGYAVAMSGAALSKLPEPGERVRVLTYLQVSESGAALFGFLTEDEKSTFEKLITVSGIGPKVALAALSTFSPRALADAVANQDTALIARIPGVGKKTASRIVLDLKGSLDVEGDTLFAAREEIPSQDASKAAFEALLSMGFTSAEAELALAGAPEGAGDSALLQYALKRLGSR